MRRVVLATACLLTLSIAASEAHAQRHPFNAGGVSQLGGQVLPANRNALAAGGLYPSLLWAQYTIGMSRSTDLGLRGDFFFASPMETEFGFGLGFSVPIRFALSQGQKASFAFKLAPGLVLGDFDDDEFDRCIWNGNNWRCRADPDEFDGPYDDDDFAFGPSIEIGLLVGIPVGIVNIICGVTSPIHFIVFEDHEGLDFYFPVAPFGGAEVRLTPDLNVFGMMQPGVSIHANKYDTDAEGFFRFWAGIEYAL